MNRGAAKTIADLRAILDDLEAAVSAVDKAKSDKELADADYKRLVIAKGLQLGAMTVNREIGKKVLAKRASLRYEG